MSVIAGSPFKACVVSPDRVAPVGGWLSILNGQSVVSAVPNKMQMVAFETCQAGHGIYVQSGSSVAYFLTGLTFPSNLLLL